VQLKQLWREWGQGVEKDYLTAEEFWRALCKLGIELKQEDGEAMMRKFSAEKDIIKFEEFVIHFLALPNNFFTQQHVRSETLMNKSAVQDRQQIQIGAKFPKGTSLEQIDKKFRIKLRQELFNIQRVLFIVLKSPNASTKHMGKGELYNVFAGLGIMCTQRELDEILDYFDHNDDGKIHMEEMACELLGLPRPGDLRGTLIKDGVNRLRPDVAARTMEIINCLRLNCERAAVTPKSLVTMFKHFDTDGSGNVAYDEVREMVREYNCNVDGGDAAAMLLEKYSGTAGQMSYMQFITKVLGLRADSLRGVALDRMATPEVQQTVGAIFKERMFHNKAGVKKAFGAFDRDGSGMLSFKEFCDGVKALGLPISSKHLKKIFAEMDEDGGGNLTIDELAEQVLHVPGVGVDEGFPPPPGALQARQPNSSFMDLDFLENMSREGTLTSRSSASSLGSKMSSRYSYDARHSFRDSLDGDAVGDLQQKLLQSAKDLQRLESIEESLGSLEESGFGGTAPSLAPPVAIPKRSARMLPSRSRSVPLSSPYTSARSSHLGSAIEQMISSQGGGGGASIPMRGAPLLTGRSTSRSSLSTHRSLTATQQRAQDKLNMNRATFEASPGKMLRSPPKGLPALDPGAKVFKKTRKILGPNDMPQPVYASHGVDGRATMPLKQIGAGGGTQSQRAAWGPDRSMNQNIAQPLGPP